MTRRTLRPEERRIWARVASSVTPRPGRTIPDIEQSDPVGARATARADAAGPSPRLHGLVLAGAHAKPPAAPQQRSGEKRVRRGRVEIDGRLDLHGMTQDQARSALLAFLRRLQAGGGRCGLVITGKGRSAGGSGEGVLRRRLPEWLAEPPFATLSAGYAPAHAKHGGEGAWYVFVKKVGRGE